MIDDEKAVFLNVVEKKVSLALNKVEHIEKKVDLLDYEMDRNSRELDELQFAVKIAKRNIEQDIQSVKNKTEDIIEILK